MIGMGEAVVPSGDHLEGFGFPDIFKNKASVLHGNLFVHVSVNHQAMMNLSEDSGQVVAF